MGASSLTYTIIFHQTLVHAPRESISATVAIYLPVLMSAVIAVNPGRMGLTRQTLLKQKEMVFFTLPVGAALWIWSSRAACARACASERVVIKKHVTRRNSVTH